MDFELTDEQKDIKRAAREFAEGMFPGVAEECDINETFPRKLWKKACDLGFVGVFIDEAYGDQVWAFWKMCSSWRSSAEWMQGVQVLPLRHWAQSSSFYMGEKNKRKNISLV